MAQAQLTYVPAGHGRTLEVLIEGRPDGFPLVYHSGTPSAAVTSPTMSAACVENGLRLITWSRPGYAGSTEQPGRSVADVTVDTQAVLAALGHDRFVTLGWSGGGPHALACAALLPESCAAATSLAGVAPWGADGLDWLAGMGEENEEEFAAAVAGPEPLAAYLHEQARGLVEVSGQQVAEAFGGLVSGVDRAALTGDYAEEEAASLRAAVSCGVAGWRDDDLAFVRPWGFELAEIAVPVAVWQGGQDRMVPKAHGAWLAAHLPDARAHLYADEGHLSLVSRLGAIFADLVELAGGI
ncbi:MAG: alpha/beta fold hydrolase [Nocardioidaceae bacterium]